MGSTVLPSSLLPLHAAAAAPRGCASRLRLNPACIAAAAAAKNPKRPRSSREDDPPLTKRRRAGEDGGAPAAAKREKAMSLAEKEAVNNQLVSLLLLGSGSRKVSPLPDSIVRLLQENRTGRGDGDGDIEIDVHALTDDALRLIKNRVGAYLDNRARHEEAPKQSKQDPVIKQSMQDPVIKQSKKDPVIKQSKQDAVIKQADTKTTSASSQHQPATTKESMKELLSYAHVAMERVRRRRYLEELRAKARWEVDQIVRTVEWNDPYIDIQDVFK
ncbi:hypothetical protein ACP70R_029192 [Stipagrostis hirtigluma subsp. patula]